MPAKRPLDLHATGLRIRRPALIAAALIVVLLLAVPLLLRAIPTPPAVAAVLPTDTLWSSGRISNAHQSFGSDCATCHERLFVRVRDNACLACHDGIGHHSEQPTMAGLGALDERRCADCHREHGGTHAVLPSHPGLCADCHGRPHRFADFVQLATVRDFGRAHPEFRATVTRRDNGRALEVRAPLSEQALDENGLIFPHDVHLAEDGVLGPDGPSVLACADCHRPDTARIGFEPIHFEAHCQDCHQLDVGVGTEVLRLPHADSDEVRQRVSEAVRALPARVTAPDRGERRRAGPAAARGAAPTAEDLVAEVFSTRVCAKCHMVETDADDQPDVQQVVLRQSWFAAARFTHADHGWVACGDCHAAAASTDANDLLLPGIATCRDCHTGLASTKGIQTACIDCHRFHQATGVAMGRAKKGVAPGGGVSSEMD